MEHQVNMQHEDDALQRSQLGWKAQVISFYKKFFKSGNGNDLKKSKDAASPGRLRVAGEHEVEQAAEKDSSELSEHTVVDLAQPPAGPAVLPTLPDRETPVEASAKPANLLPVEPTADQSKNTLVIKNLPFKFKLADLEKLLSDREAKAKNVRLLRDDSGKFTGMAFVRCASKDDAQKLISSMHGLDISGRSIQVEFKTKKQKKNRKLLTMSSESCSSSDELPAVNRLRVSSSDQGNNTNTTPAIVPAPQPQPPQVAPPQQQKFNKLSVSAEHNFEEKQRKQPQPSSKRRSSCIDTYTHSAVHKIHSIGAPVNRPVRQPYGPDGKTNGFSTEYKKSRGV